MNMKKLFQLALAFLIIGPLSVFAQPLTADKAFTLTSHMENKQLILEWNIAPGYFLYRDKIAISAPEGSQVKIGAIHMPEGTPRKDEIHGNYQIYTHSFKVPVELIGATGTIPLQVKYQGCSLQGFCYPPIKKTLQINLNGSSVPITSAAEEQNYAAKILDGKSTLFIIFSFLGLGILMAFTPCVLPMVPILSGIIVGHGNQISTRKAFMLSLAYVLGMALTYAAAGIVVAMLGSSVQAALEKTWVIVAFSALFVVLALSMFDFYEFKMPSSWQSSLTNASNKLQGGTYVGVFLMGALSTLIVSPCISAPLVGVLGFIGNTGNVVLGGTALLAMGFGMGLPLLAIGTSAGKFLPKAGAWMEIIKEIFGFLMLGFAIWMLSRVIPGTISLLLWGTLFIVAALYLVTFSKAKQSWKKATWVSSVFAVVYGVVLVTGAVKGNSDPLHPLLAETKLPFVVVKNQNQLNAELKKAMAAKKLAMLDFYADWCTSCVLIDKHVFSQNEIKQALSNVVLLRADVTANNDFDQAILKQFQVFVPPAILFFDHNGKEVSEQRMVGEVDTKKFMAHLNIVKEDVLANK